MSRQYKALISDFDNTIAGRDHTIPDTVVKELQSMIARGYIFTIATGRFFYGAIREEAKRIGLKHPMITSGGAQIIDPVTEEILWGEYIPKSEFEPIIEYFLSKKIFFLIEAEDVLYHPPLEDVTRFEPTSKYESIENFKAERTTKIVIPAGMGAFDEKVVDDISEYLTANYKDLHIAKIAWGHHFGLDITSERASKHLGVLEWLKMMKLEADDIVAVGDGYNDYPLLTAAGTKVAMGDAPQVLKDIADLVVPTQKENGVLTVIETYFK